MDNEDRVHVCATEYYTAVENNEVMPFAATWMDIEMIILSKSDKDKYLMMSLICGIYNAAQMGLSWWSSG